VRCGTSGTYLLIPWSGRSGCGGALAAEILAAMSQQAVYVTKADQAIDLARAACTSDAKNSPEWLSYFDEAHLSDRIAHCFRDLGQGSLAFEYARRSLKMNGDFVRGRAFNFALLGPRSLS